MGTMVAPIALANLVEEKSTITRLGSVTIADGRHPEPLTFDRDNAEELAKVRSMVKEYTDAGFVVAVEDVVVKDPAQFNPDAESVMIVAPLVGG